MEPVLDEVGLRPVVEFPPVGRVLRLAETIQALDRLGARRVLRAIEDAANLDIGGGRGLRSWCFDRSGDRDAGRLVASRLDQAPYLDGPDGLFAKAEGNRAVQASIGGIPTIGAGYVALMEGVLVALAGQNWPLAAPVKLEFLEEDGAGTEEVEIAVVTSPADVEQKRAILRDRIERAVRDGSELLRRAPELFPRLVFGERAREQMGTFSGTEAFFRQVVRHLGALDRAGGTWKEGPFSPAGISFSVESQATLSHGEYGPMRDFPTPDGFDTDRWSLHTKFTGGTGGRMYYKTLEVMERDAAGMERRGMRVAIGYVGPHLPTVRFH